MKRWKIIVGVSLLAALGLVDYALWDFVGFDLRLYKSDNNVISQMRLYAMSLVDKMGMAILANYVVTVFLFVKWVMTSKRKQKQI